MIKSVAIQASNFGLKKIKKIAIRYVFGYFLIALALFFFMLAIAELMVSTFTFISRAELFMYTALALVVISILVRKFLR